MEEHLVQGSDAWRLWRRDKIGASDAPVIMGLSPWMTPQELWEEKLGIRPEKDLSYAMARGVELEDVARRCYEDVTGNFVYPHVVTHPDFDWCVASLDGITLDQNIIVEIKVPGKKTVEMAMSGIIPDHYRCQMMHQMFVTNLKSCDYFCYDGVVGHLIRLDAEEDFIADMMIKELEFIECLKTKTPPKTDREKNVKPRKLRKRKHDESTLCDSA